MRRIIIIAFAFLLACGISMLEADNIPLISESMPALGEVGSFVKYGDYALFIGGEKHLQIMDFSSPQQPELISGLDVPGMNGSATFIDVYEHYAYLFFNGTVAIVSLSDIFAPQLLSTAELGIGLVSQSIHDNVLYISRNPWDSYNVYSYSLSDPLSPMLLDSLTVNIYPRSISCGDGFLVCGDTKGIVLDTSNPANLQLLSEITYISSTYYGYGAIAVSGTMLVVGCDYYVSVYDFSKTPYLQGTISLPYRVEGFTGYIHGNSFWCQCLDYYGNDGAGVMGIDFSNPESPQVCYTEMFYANGIFRFYMDEELMSLRTNQNAQYIKFSVLDSSNTPDFAISYPMESIGSIVANDKWVVGVNSNRFIQIVGVPEDNTTVLPFYSFTPNNFSSLKLHGDILLYTTRAEPYQNGSATRYLVLFDLVTQTQKAILELGPSFWGNGEIIVAGDIAYICNKDEGLFVVDISNPEQPLLLCFLQEYINYDCAVVGGGKLYVGSGYSIRCYDISLSPVPVFMYEMPLYLQNPFIKPFKLLKKDNYLYAITFGRYLACIKLGNAEAEEINIYETRYSTNSSLMALGDGLMVGSCDGLAVFSLKDPMHPQEVAWRDVERVQEGDYIVFPSYAIKGDHVYVGRGKSLQVLSVRLATTLTGFGAPDAKQKLMIFPNPGKGNINVICNLPAAGVAELELYNLRGQKVCTKTYSTMKEGLNLLNMETKDDSGSFLGSGVYFLKMKQGSYKQVGKLLLSR